MNKWHLRCVTPLPGGRQVLHIIVQLSLSAHNLSQINKFKQLLKACSRNYRRSACLTLSNPSPQVKTGKKSITGLSFNFFDIIFRGLHLSVTKLSHRCKTLQNLLQMHDLYMVNKILCCCLFSYLHCATPMRKRLYGLLKPVIKR
jgi:hypothetical protein